MAQQPQQTGPKLTYIDRPEIPETFVDSLENVLMDNSVLRLEFVVNRLDRPRPPSPPTGKKYTACRLVLPMPAIIQVANKLNQLIAALQAQGTLQIIPAPPANTDRKPN